MHHKLLKSRLLNQKRTADTIVSHLPPAKRMSEGSMESTVATFNDQIAFKSDQPNANVRRAPLNLDSANIVAIDMESRKSDCDQTSSSQDSKEAILSSQPQSRLEEAIRRFSASPDQVLFGRRDAAQILGGTNLLGFHLGSMTTQNSRFAQKLAQERDALVFILQQRQHQNALEQVRRIQTAMLLHQQGGPSGGNNTLAYLGAVANLRNIPRRPPVDHVDFLPSRPTPNSSISRAPGANQESLSLASKRSLDDIAEKDIKEWTDPYQRLSKKAKPTLQASKPSEISKSKKDNAPKEEEDELSSSSEGREAGHRFRPYQYEQWTEKFQELCDFRKERGHCQVPHTYKENPPLARWVKRQRYQYKLKTDGKSSTMTDERVMLLENIGFIWDSHAAAWAEKLHELKEYAKLKGDCNVPSTYPDNPQLATWVKCQRRQYKLLRDKKISNMTMERILELELIGFVWEVRTKNFD